MRTLEITRWRRERRAFGRIRCTPPEGEELAEIIIHEHVQPLTSLRVLADQLGAGSTAIGSAMTLATVEGEIAAIASFEVAGIYHTLGVVYGDDFQAIIDGRTARVDQRERLREVTQDLVLHFPLGLGHRRHRRFWYRPPPQWQGLARGLITDWFPLDHPRNPGSIKVLPARPIDGVFHLDTLLRDDQLAEVTIDELTHTTLPLPSFRAAVASAVAGERAFQTAVLEDRQYIYVLRLATTVERLPEHEAVFHELLRSCQPLPLPASTTAAGAEAMDYWT